MNAKKIIKGIVKFGVVSGIEYLSYKIGESNERFRDKYGDEDNIKLDDDDEFQFYNHMDEPDDGCIAPADG